MDVFQKVLEYFRRSYLQKVEYDIEVFISKFETSMMFWSEAEDELMVETCICGKAMDVRLRTVIFSNQVEIKNVPVYSCKRCRRSTVFPEIKEDLTGVIDQLGEKPSKQTIDLTDHNEFANLLYMASDQDRLHIPIQELIQERINQLLDLMLIAKSLGDEQWFTQLQGKLSQISSKAFIKGNG